MSERVSPPLSEVILPKRELLQSSTLPLFVPGNGPVVHRQTREQAESAGTTPGNEDSSLWSQNLVKAIYELYKQKVAYQILVNGGRTGGLAYLAESELIKRELVEKYRVPPEIIQTEDKSIDTVENIRNALNQYNIPLGQKVNTLCAKHHSLRTRLMLKLFAIPVQNAFAAEEVLRHIAQTSPDSEGYNRKLSIIEGMVDLVHYHTFKGKTYYELQKGTEIRDYADLILYEAVWLRETLTYPARILSPAAELTDDARLREIVKLAMNVYGEGERIIESVPYSADDTPEIHRKKVVVNRKREIQNRMNVAMYGFDLENDTPEKLREKMRKFDWPFLTPKEKAVDVQNWLTQIKTSDGWSPEIRERLRRLQAYKLPQAQT